MEQEYNFQTGLSREASLNFYYNHNQIKYETLTEFIRVQILNKKEKMKITFCRGRRQGLIYISGE